jgi:hypothetical protein
MPVFYFGVCAPLHVALRDLVALWALLSITHFQLFHVHYCLMMYVIVPSGQWRQDVFSVQIGLMHPSLKCGASSGNGRYNAENIPEGKCLSHLA